MDERENSPINQMYYGQRGQCDTIQMNKEYSELLEKYIKIEDEFEEKFLTDEVALYLYRKVMDANSLVNCEENFCYYKEGFSFGVLLGLEIAATIKKE